MRCRREGHDGTHSAYLMAGEIAHLLAGSSGSEAVALRRRPIGLLDTILLVRSWSLSCRYYAPCFAAQHPRSCDFFNSTEMRKRLR